MAITRLGGANAITGTLPAANINDTSIGNITALPAAIATGKVLQVVSTVKTDTFSSTSTSFTDVTGMSVAITPSASNSKVLIIATLNVGNDTNDRWSAYRLLRGSTGISIGDDDGNKTRASAGSVRQTATGSQNLVSNMSISFLENL